MQDKWWVEKAEAVQPAADRKDTKTLYKLLNEVYGPIRDSISPVRSKDGNVLLTDIRSNRNRWKEHLSELLNRLSTVDMDVINQLRQHTFIF